jgi:tight adherence protein B
MYTAILVGGIVLAILLLTIGIIVSIGKGKSEVDSRLQKYLEEEKQADSRADHQPITDWVNKRVEKSTIGERIARELARADLKFKPGEWMALYVIAIVGGGFVTYLLGGRVVVSAVIGMVIGGVIPGLYLKNQKSKRLVRFNNQLPDMLNLMVNGLRAGFSTLQAMEAVSKEMPSPICDEIRRVVQEMQLGITMEKALANLLRRIPSQDLDFLITAMNVQREVGGNLAEIMDVISYTIRERVRIKGDIRSLTAQMMISGRVLALMPIALLCILWFLNRSYIMEFFNADSILCGGIALGTAGLLILVGYFVMTRIANIEV